MTQIVEPLNEFENHKIIEAVRRYTWKMSMSQPLEKKVLLELIKPVSITRSTL